jgi:hypothetical protein
MPTSKSSILISEGLSPRSPWLLENLDSNFKDYAVANLALSGSKQMITIRTQTNVLNEQTNQLDRFQDYSEKLKAGTETGLVLDKVGNVLIDNPNIVSDLIGRQASSLSSSDIDRLIDFTADLANSEPAINLGGQAFVAVNVVFGQPAADLTIEAPLRVWNTVPSDIATTDIEPYVCYAYRAANGDISYRICDRDKADLRIMGVASAPVPDKNLVYDAYRLNTGSIANPVYKTFVPQKISGAFPTSQTPETLFRNVFTGELRLVGPSQSNITFEASQGFIIPSSQSEVNFLFGQAGAKRLQDASTQFKTDEVKLHAPDTFQWKYKDFQGGGFADYPPRKGLPSDINLPVGSVIEDSGTGKLYFISGRVAGTNKFVEVEKQGSEFVLKLSVDSLLDIRGQYTELISRATQRTAEQQSFLNSLVQKFNLFSDVATNILKTLSDSESRLSSSL